VLSLAFPAWTEHVSWLWTNPAAYNFASSEWGGLVFRIVELVAVFGVGRWLLKPWIDRWVARVHKHLECDAPGCERWGRPVHGTSHRACHEHHPHLDVAGTPPERIALAAQLGHNHPDLQGDPP
jgi:hypothetical protein